MRENSISKTNSSEGATALADFPVLRDPLARLRATIAETGWTPWAILGLAILLRFFLLGVKPPHFDEGINGWFVDQMVKTGFYRYDPTNYHGPLHFYVLWLSQALFGRNLLALRLPVVLVSIGCVWLALRFEPFVGRTASRLAALAMAVSPGFVFYGRYSIHEAWLLLFSMLFILGLLGLWQSGSRNYLWCVGMGVTGMILSKETYIIHIGCALIALAVLKMFNALIEHAILFARSEPSVAGSKTNWLKKTLFRLVSAWRFIVRKALPAVEPLPAKPWAKQNWDRFDLAVVIGVSVFAIVFFYSGTFFHSSGLKGLYLAYKPWFTTGSEGHGHEKSWFYWLRLIAPSFEFNRADCLGYELPVMLGLLMCLASLRFKNLNLRYLAIYGVGTFAAYSIVNYKTPWCIISIVWPLLFVFGSAVITPSIKYSIEIYALVSVLICAALGWAIYRGIWVNADYTWVFPYCGGLVATLIALVYIPLMRFLCGAILFLSFGSAIWLNYFHCTTDYEPYVYVQTYNDIYELTDPLLTLAHRDPLFYQLTGHIIRTSAYPLPWILDDFTKVGYYEHNNSPPSIDADFLLVQEDRVEEIEAKLHDTYFTQPLRIRPYQDTSKLYLSARIFKGFFPGQQPDFVGKPAGEEKPASE